MSISVIDFMKSPYVREGFEKRLLDYIRESGQITSLDKLAHEVGVDPKWVRHCAHSAASKGLVKMTRLKNKVGRPYRVTLQEESHENRS